jgi:hypothetical protein
MKRKKNNGRATMKVKLTTKKEILPLNHTITTTTTPTRKKVNQSKLINLTTVLEIQSMALMTKKINMKRIQDTTINPERRKTLDIMRVNTKMSIMIRIRNLTMEKHHQSMEIHIKPRIINHQSLKKRNTSPVMTKKTRRRAIGRTRARAIQKITISTKSMLTYSKKAMPYTKSI